MFDNMFSANWVVEFVQNIDLSRPVILLDDSFFKFDVYENLLIILF